MIEPGIFREPTQQEKKDFIPLNGNNRDEEIELITNMRTQFSKFNRICLLKSKEPKKEILGCFECWRLERKELENTDNFEEEYKNYQRLNCNKLIMVNGIKRIILGNERKEKEFIFHYHCNYCQSNLQVPLNEDLLKEDQFDKFTKLTQSEVEY